MIWINKYRPKSFSEITTHKELVSMLSSYTLENIPNLILHGPTGSNKRTLLYSLINHLYGKYPELHQNSIEMKVNTTTISVNYYESDEMVLINPSEHGIKDRHVVQNIIKSMADNKPILSLLGNYKRSVRIVVITMAENLSKDAQAALRRTIEVYSSHFKVILVTTELSKLIEPIRSRCLFVRTRAFSDEEVKEVCKDVSKKESFDVSEETLDQIVKNSKGNCMRGLLMLELCHVNKFENESKRRKNDLSNFRLDWEKKIDEIVVAMKKARQPSALLQIRKDLYYLLGSGVPATEIISEILNSLSTVSEKNYIQISNFALSYDERIKKGSKDIFHLEAFIATTINVLMSSR